jgi:hypothetical protein
MEDGRAYASYMLRLRQMHRGPELVWVASLHSVATSEEHSFPSIRALVAFLLDEYENDVSTANRQEAGTSGQPEDQYRPIRGK